MNHELASPAASRQELATNALEHTSTGDGGQFQVTICRTGTSLLIGVSDSGSDKTPASGPLDLESETGRGLGLVELIADRWGYCGGEHGRTVWFEIQALLQPMQRSAGVR